MGLLEISNLCVSSNGKDILKGVDLNINKGEIHVLMGPNGAGKSTLANAILNNRSYIITEGKVSFNGGDLKGKTTDEIARKGIFMSFQSPEEIPGISVLNFIKYSKSKIDGEMPNYFEFREELTKNMKELDFKESYASRNMNVGFSGGEKKKNEILQMLTLKPKFVILDETDSGLDIDAIKIVTNGLNMYLNEDNAALIITHNMKILEGLKNYFVHVLINGKIVANGDKHLAKEIEKKGYDMFKQGDLDEN